MQSACFLGSYDFFASVITEGTLGIFAIMQIGMEQQEGCGG